MLINTQASTIPQLQLRIFSGKKHKLKPIKTLSTFIISPYRYISFIPELVNCLIEWLRWNTVTRFYIFQLNWFISKLNRLMEIWLAAPLELTILGSLILQSFSNIFKTTNTLITASSFKHLTATLRYNYDTNAKRSLFSTYLSRIYLYKYVYVSIYILFV